MAALHVGIAGAGLVGRTLAWRLLRAGCRVTLLDVRQRGAWDTASMVAAAMLSPIAELAQSNQTVFDLGQRSMDLWPQWVGELQAESEVSMPPVYFRREGTVVVAHAPDQGVFAHFGKMLQRKLPPPYQGHLRALDADGLAAMEPALAGRFGGGLYLQGEGQLDNAQWMDALASAIDRMGAVWHEGAAVHSLQAHRIRAQGLDLQCDVAVDARGVGARAQLPGLRGVRGEVLRVECRGLHLQRPVRLVHPRYQLYVAPRAQHQFVVGATEIETEDMGEVTLRSMLELGSALYSLHPAFGEARVQRLSAALRPTMDDDMPVCRQVDGVWHLNGLYRHGYLCAPALVDALCHNIVQQTQ